MTEVSQLGQTGAANNDSKATQEIRFATVLNGGVSLAVWISGVVLELHHLALSSQRLGSWSTYRRVLDVLEATARVDVIAGTSAGGLNGAFLALGQAHHRDLARLRDLWTNDGGLDQLLRAANDPDPASLLRGDEYFLVCLRDALREVLEQEPVEYDYTAESPDPLPIGLPDAPPVELTLTGTLWTGRDSAFTDDMGVGITERDYDATFWFANHVPEQLSDAPGNLDSKDAASIVEQLARAARCTSSFPGAFEPHLVVPNQGAAAQGRWPTSAGQANFNSAQYVLDGGILLNKPIRPALEAIYRQPGENQIRRVLAYVVPDPGEAPEPQPNSQDPPATATGTRTSTGPVPNAGDVVLGVMTRLRSTDSVARELEEIRQRNAAVRDRKRARVRLSGVLASGTAGLVEALWEDYRAERVSSAAATIGRLIAAGQVSRQSASDSGDRRLGQWSEREITDALLRQAARDGFSFVPEADLSSALTRTGFEWHWGQTTVLRLLDMTSDLLQRALQLASFDSNEQHRIVNCRSQLLPTTTAIRADRRSLDDFWFKAPSGPDDLRPIPSREGVLDITGRNSSAANVSALESWLDRVLAAWDEQPIAKSDVSRVADAAPAGATPPSPGVGAGTPPDGVTPPGGARRALQYQQAIHLAECVFEYRDTIQAIVEDPNEGAARIDVTYLENLCSWLLTPATSAQDVLGRMLQLDVVLVAVAGTLANVEQEVELVQMSCSSVGTITGRQLHHFGAFYRAPWRINDWIEGRLDGARQVMRTLLSPDRLRQLGRTSDDLLNALEPIAIGRGDPNTDADDQEWFAAEWQRGRAHYRDELDAALAPDRAAAAAPTGHRNRLVVALDALADAIAAPLQLGILREDLAALADAIRTEGDDAMPGSRAWLRLYEAKLKAPTEATPPAQKPRPRSANSSESSTLSAGDAWLLRDQMRRLVGTQTITDDVGSDTFARTVSHAAAVGAGVINNPPKIGKVRVVRFVLSALRGYTAMVWAMVSYLSRGRFGAEAVGMAVAVGGALLAVTVLVPGVPIGVSLAGAGLVLAGASAAALRTPRGQGLGWRLLIATLLVAGAFGYLVWRDIDQHGFNGNVLTTLIKVGVGALIVLLGWFLSSSGRHRRPTAVQAVRASETPIQPAERHDRQSLPTEMPHQETVHATPSAGRANRDPDQAGHTPK